MTNLCFKRGVLAVSAVLFLLAGCKKDDTSSSFTITGPTSMQFEYGQTKQTTYSARNIVKYAYETPDGWTCSAAGGIITITAPAAGTGVASGTIKITATATTSTEIARTLDVAVKIAEKLTGNANSFMVSKPGQRYKFDARVKGNASSATMTPDDAALVWCSSTTAISNISLENDGYIYFFTEDATSLVRANALIAAVDANGAVLWSWHIWAAYYDPATDFNTLGGKTVMSCNLGALASSNAATDDVLKSYGLYYQWGRKDPFPGPNAWNSTAQLNVYNAKSKVVTITYKTTASDIGTAAYAAANPTTFIAGIKDTNYDWLFKARDNSLWGSTKTVNDPCPVGWKVTPASVWASFTTTGKSSETPAEFNVDGAYSYGWTFNDDNTDPTYWPAAGRRSFSNLLASSNKNFTNVINGEFGADNPPVGFYWSSTAATASESNLLAFRDDYVNPGDKTYTKIDDGDDESAWSPEGARRRIPATMRQGVRTLTPIYRSSFFIPLNSRHSATAIAAVGLRYRKQSRTNEEQPDMIRLFLFQSASGS